MTSEQFIKIRNLIEKEFSHAVKKHPKFADLFTNPRTDWARLERTMKRENDENAPPYSEHGKKLGVYHYRLFCDEAWKPIMPRGEVYSTQFTERGWKSFSEIHKI